MRICMFTWACRAETQSFLGLVGVCVSVRVRGRALLPLPYTALSFRGRRPRNPAGHRVSSAYGLGMTGAFKKKR